jgi:hypothetical protein
MDLEEVMFTPVH